MNAGSCVTVSVVHFLSYTNAVSLIFIYFTNSLSINSDWFVHI